MKPISSLASISGVENCNSVFYHGIILLAWYNFSGSSNGLSVFSLLFVSGVNNAESLFPFSLFLCAGLLNFFALDGRRFFVSFVSYTTQMYSLNECLLICFMTDSLLCVDSEDLTIILLVQFVGQ